MWCHVAAKTHYELFLKVTPAAAVLLSLAFSLPSRLKIYVFVHGFTFQKGGVHLLDSVLLLGIIRYCNLTSVEQQASQSGFKQLAPLLSFSTLVTK